MEQLAGARWLIMPGLINNGRYEVWSEVCLHAKFHNAFGNEKSRRPLKISITKSNMRVLSIPKSSGFDNYGASSSNLLKAMD